MEVKNTLVAQVVCFQMLRSQIQLEYFSEKLHFFQKLRNF